VNALLASPAWSTTTEAAEDGPAAAAVPVPPATFPHRRQPVDVKKQQKPRYPVTQQPEEVESELGSGSQRPSRVRKPPAYLSEYACRIVSQQN